MTPTHTSQRGNVLFLILIAVALFAALSYAVTSSNRTGGSAATSEKNALAAAEMTQYGVSLRSTLMRMRFNGIDPTAFNFEMPPPQLPNAVFFKNGGGAIFQEPPLSIRTLGPYEFLELQEDDGFYIAGIGTNTTSTGRDIVLAAYVDQATCLAINKALGLPSTIGVNSALYIESGGETFYSVGDNVLDGAPGQAAACVVTLGTKYIYYYALLER